MACGESCKLSRILISSMNDGFVCKPFPFPGSCSHLFNPPGEDWEEGASCRELGQVRFNRHLWIHHKDYIQQEAYMYHVYQQRMSVLSNTTSTNPLQTP